MFCTKCGRQIADDAQVCDYCGAKIGEEIVEDDASAAEVISEKVNDLKEKVANNADLKRIVLGVAAVVVLLILVLIANALLGSSPKKAVKGYLEAEYEMDVKDMYKYSLANKTAQKKLDIYDEDDFEDEYDEAVEAAEEALEKMEDNDVEIDYDIDVKEVEKLKDDDKEWEWAAEYLEDVLKADADALKGVAIVKVREKVTVEVDGDKQDSMSGSETVKYVAVKIGSKWYSLGLTVDSLERLVGSSSDVDLDDLEDLFN